MRHFQLQCKESSRHLRKSMKMPTIVDFVFDDRITMINKLPLSVEPNQTKMTARAAE